MNEKQSLFVKEYLIDLNATQAAIRAGYSERTAGQQGERLLKNAEVEAAVGTALAERSERTQIDADWLLIRLAEEANADLSEIYDENGNLRPIHEWPLIWRQGLVTGVETVQERIGEDADGAPVYATIRKIKLADRTKRLEMIGRHIGVQAFRDKLEVDVGQNLADIILEGRRRAAALADQQFKTIEGTVVR